MVEVFGAAGSFQVNDMNLIDAMRLAALGNKLSPACAAGEYHNAGVRGGCRKVRISSFRGSPRLSRLILPI